MEDVGGLPGRWLDRWCRSTETVSSWLESRTGATSAGVGGAWVVSTTRERAEGMGFAWAEVAADNDSHRRLAALDQLIPGGHTGWNLCDLYVACVASRNVGVSEQERDRL